MVRNLPVKTTIILKDEIYEYLVKRFGRRKISEAVNQALMEKLFRPVKSMFGADPWLTTEGLRDEGEPHETS
jgi:hypothetical protein